MNDNNYQVNPIQLIGNALVRACILIGIVFSLVSVFACTVNAAESGSCGNGVKYYLDNDGTLTISGNGYMTNYSNSFASPFGSDIKSVIIKNGVKNIGNYAFYNCQGIMKVTIPDSVTSIGIRAFFYCSELTNVTIPNSVTSIGDSAFGHCSKLTTVTIPSSITSIDDFTFDYCRALTDILIPNSVTSIGRYAFRYCNELQM